MDRQDTGEVQKPEGLSFLVPSTTRGSPQAIPGFFHRDNRCPQPMEAWVTGEVDPGPAIIPDQNTRHLQ